MDERLEAAMNDDLVTARFDRLERLLAELRWWLISVSCAGIVVITYLATLALLESAAKL